MGRRRGVYKVPGGKLVAVEFVVVDGLLRDVVVTGDFFLYPEEALPVLAFAIEGAPVALAREALAERIAGAIPADVQLVGASPEALAMAVARGLTPPDDEAPS
ncbi:MAG: biotin--protein ligase [Thermomicrobiales bacterium]|nr:biotin--protein ligase [Thermomicrobiales bacterium]